MAKSRENTGFCYPIELPVQYEILPEGRHAGTGQTLSISSEVVHFQCNRRLPVDQKIRLVLAWPAPLPDGARLNLWIVGAIAQSAVSRVEVRILSHEFKTRRTEQAHSSLTRDRSLSASLAPAISLSVIRERS